MRDYGKVVTLVWHNRRFRALPEDGKLVYLYLLTCEHSNMLGLFRLPVGYGADDINWPIETHGERFYKGLTTVIEAGLASYEKETQTVLVHKYLKHDPMANPNVVTGAIRTLERLSNGSGLLSKLLSDIEELEKIPDHYQPLISHLRTVGKPFPNPEPQPEPLPEPQQEHQQKDCSDALLAAKSTGLALVESPAVSLPKVKPVKAPKDPAKTTAVWNAYADAYHGRWGAPPVRNAKVNSQLSKFIDHVGAEDAPAIAAYYCGSSSNLYVGGMHPIDLLLRDFQKLRTEWMTKRRVTSTSARQVDQTSTRGTVFSNLASELAGAKQ